MFARLALATALLAATVSVAAADGPTRLNGAGLNGDVTMVVDRPTSSEYLIITMEN